MVSKLFTAAVAFAGAATAAVPTNVAKFNAYWGQSGPPDESLRERCDEGADYISLSFVTSSPEHNPSGYPGIGFAAHCWGTAFKNPEGVESQLLDHCETIINDLQYCRDKGTKMLLSIGGVWNKETADYRVSTEQNGRDFADFLWGAFGPYDASWTGPRPFDKPGQHSAVDGFDFDLELPNNEDGSHFDNKPWIAMADQFRKHSKDVIITAAPQCPTANAYFYMKPLIQQAQFDALFIQFYNNVGCDLIIGNDPWNSQDDFNYKDWEDVIAKSDQSKDAKLFVGVPAAPGNGYVHPKALEHIICPIAKRDSFGGISIWDMWTGKNNVVDGKSFNEHVQDILSKCGKHTTVTTSTTTTTTSTTSSTTSTTTTTTTTTSSSSSTTTSTSTSTPTSTSTSSQPTSSSSSSSSSSMSSSSSSSTSSAQPTSSSSSSSSSSMSSSSSAMPTSSSSSSSSSAVPTSESSSSSSMSSSSSAMPTSSSSSSSSSAVPTSESSSSSSMSSSSSAVPTSSSSSSSAMPTSESSSSSSSAMPTSESSSSSAMPTSESSSSSSSAMPTSESSSSSAQPTSSSSSSSAMPTSETSSSSVVPTMSTSSSVIMTTGPATTSVVTSAPWSNSTTTEEMTTSTVQTTTTYTITSCAPTVTNCPVGHVTTETIDLYTTICPVTKTHQPHQPTTTPSQGPSSQGPPEEMTTSTVYTTSTYTISKCPPSVTNCPVGQVTTETISVSTTVCPVSKTNEVPQTTQPTGKPPGGEQPTGQQTSMTTTTMHSTTTKTVIKTLSTSGPKTTAAVTPSQPAGNQCPGGPNCPSTPAENQCPGGPNCPSTPAEHKCPGSPDCPPVGTGGPSAPVIKPTNPVVTAGASSVAAGLVALIAAQVFLL